MTVKVVSEVDRTLSDLPGLLELRMDLEMEDPEVECLSRDLKAPIILRTSVGSTGEVKSISFIWNMTVDDTDGKWESLEHQENNITVYKCCYIDWNYHFV